MSSSSQKRMDITTTLDSGSSSQKRKIADTEEFSGERKKKPLVGTTVVRASGRVSTSSIKNKEKEKAKKDISMETVIMYPRRKVLKVNETDYQLNPFTTLVQKSRETDDKLLDVMKEYPYVNLPKLGSNKLQDRLHFSNGILPLICRSHHNEISNAVINALSEENNSRGLYICGPSGFGMSYSLYYLVCELRLQPDYRVTYINSCEEWWTSHQLEKYQYLLNELLCTFNKDVLSPLAITDWAEVIMNGFTENIHEKLDNAEFQYTAKANRISERLRQPMTRRERFSLFLNELMDFVKNEYYWIWIFDQYNTLYKHKCLDEYPFVLINGLPGFLKEAGLVIVSETFNDEVNQFKSWNKLQLFGGYDDDEFDHWRTFRGYENDAHLNTVKYWTGAYPLELDIWHKIPIKSENLQEKTEIYVRVREGELARDYQLYRENLTEKGLKDLNQCIISMILQSSPPPNTYDMNYQFMHIGIVSFSDGDEELKSKTVIAACPLVRQTIMHVHGQEIIEYLTKATSVILHDEYSVNIKGMVLTLYITSILDIVREFEFRCWNFGRPSKIVFDKSITFDKIIRFVDDDIYGDIGFPNVLFIPESLNYPGVDFLIWDLDEKVLLAFQITISMPNDRKNSDDFMNGIDGQSLKSQWAKRCRINDDRVYFIWIAPENVIGQLKGKFSKDNMLVAPFSSIMNQFPALDDIKIYMNED
ncbi:hypothetical protein C1645_833697 [Glomus cerebriforme]|uniref:Uncharacterized protein n=1 Tax=Glomus cerebriforme TaxID=658196 RepID=A0A397SHK5_9GLOM|nr:hypothetical protein C1645_833789 [Glomus cerebriforme]RIA83533.1 hypothetical protein C1645_833697 [Glomus cerebriforme]